jgi:hypothetical protein
MARRNLFRPAPPRASKTPDGAPTQAVPPATARCHPDATIVHKRLKPGQPGTKGLLAQHGDALVCVRYREDTNSGQRFTTIELVVDQRPIRRQSLVRVNIAYNDADMRRIAQSLGAEWDPQTKAWQMPRAAAIRIGLIDNSPTKPRRRRVNP